MGSINLITSFYLAKNETRREEIIKSLKQNLEAPFISKIHLFLDDESCLKYIEENNLDPFKKINVVSIGKQPLYDDLFNQANKLPGEICMISNSDIWLKTSHRSMLKYLHQKEKAIYGLSRHEWDMSSPQTFLMK